MVEATEILDRDPLRAWAVGVSKSYGVDADELVAMARARQREYEAGELLDAELGLAEPEVGGDLMAAAERFLRLRGVRLADADQEQLLNALVAVSS